MNKIAAIVLLVALTGCVSSNDPKPQTNQVISHTSIAEVTSKKVFIPDDARNIHTSNDTTIMDRATIEYETELSVNHLMRLYQEDFMHAQWNMDGSSLPKGSPPDARVFGIVGQDERDLYFRNVAIKIWQCAEVTCVLIINEGYGALVDQGLN